MQRHGNRRARIAAAAGFAAIILAVLWQPVVGQQKVDVESAPAVPYESDGHLYTTFIVARLAGIDVKRSASLAWSSQIPDERAAFNAITGAAERIVGSTLGKRLMSTLHSLHGGNEAAVLRRRSDLQKLLATGLKNGTLPDWQAGLIIHALGDSYAHTKLDSQGHLVAYGDRVGHLLDGHTPDSIRRAPEKFLDYASALFFCLKGSAPVDELAGLRDKATQLPLNRAQAVAEMQAYAASLGLTPELDGQMRKSLLDQVTLGKLEETMTLMETSFGESKS